MVRLLCFGVLAVGLSSSARADEKKEEDPQIAILKAALEARTKERDELQKRVEKLENERVKLITDKERAERSAVQSENNAKLAQRVADENAKKLEDLYAKFCELRSTGGRPVAPAPRPRGTPAPVPLRGEVTKVSGAFVRVDIGIDAGVEPGSVLELVRFDGKNGPVVLGLITIARSGLFPKEALGEFRSASKVPAAKLKPEELPRVGDIVRPRSDGCN